MKYAILILTILILSIGCTPQNTTTTQEATTTETITTTIVTTTTASVTQPAVTPRSTTTTKRVTTTLAPTTTTTTSTTTTTTQDLLAEMVIVENDDAEISTIEVNTEPTGAEVRISNDYFGYSPKTKTWAPGSYRINIMKSGYESFDQLFTLEKGKKVIFNVNLTGGSSSPGFATIYVYSEPVGAQVMIDNRPYGFTPITINNIGIGNKNVKLVKVGYLDYNNWIDIIPELVINHTFVK